MIFSVSHHSRNKSKAQEIRCPYNQLGTIFDFIKNNPDKRYNILIPDVLTDTEMKKVIEQVGFVKEVAQDYTLECGHLLQLHGFLSAGYNAYLRFPVTDWETYSSLRDLEVSDIYIDGPLGFEVKKIAESKGNTRIRVSPTVSPNGGMTKTSKQPTSFFIRPEDLHLYNDMVDIIDFKQPKQEKEDALFDIYNRGTFNFNIDQLIEPLPAEINNLMFKSEFAKARLNCGQKCKIPGRSCHLCENYFTIIGQLKNLASSN